MPRLEAVAASPTYHEMTLPDGHRGRAVAQVFELPPGDPRGALTVVTAAEIENLDALEQPHPRACCSSWHWRSVAALLLIATYSIGRGLRPVDDFARSLEAVDLDDPRARLDVGSLAERVAAGGRELLGLLNRLLEALARERRYARNVAHELRNPLAEMRLLADVGARSQDVTECLQRHSRHRCGGHRDGADRGVAAGPDALRGRARVATARAGGPVGRVAPLRRVPRLARPSSAL